MTSVTCRKCYFKWETATGGVCPDCRNTDTRARLAKAIAMLEESRRECLADCDSVFYHPTQPCSCGMESWSARLDTLLEELKA